MNKLVLRRIYLFYFYFFATFYSGDDLVMISVTSTVVVNMPACHLRQVICLLSHENAACDNMHCSHHSS